MKKLEHFFSTFYTPTPNLLPCIFYPLPSKIKKQFHENSGRTIFTNQNLIIMKHKLLLLAIALLLGVQSYAQTGVAINTTGAEPDNSAMLDVSSTDKGIFVPRMTQSQRIGISNPANGLLVYQNDGTEGFYYYDGSAWTKLASGTYTETDPVFGLSPANGITSTNITNWNAAFGWGDHAGLYRPVSWVPTWSNISGNPFHWSSPANGDLMRYDLSTEHWENFAPEYLTSFTETDPLTKAVNGIVKSNGTTISAAVAATDYLTPSGSAALLTGFPTFNQSTTGSAASFTGSLAGDVTGTQSATVVGKINGTSLAALSTGMLKNTTSTGVPTIAVPGTDYLTPATGWNLSGNAGTTPGTSFIGTTDDKALVFKVNNEKAGQVSSGVNTSFGYQALNFNTTGEFNTAIGYSALSTSTSAGNNTAIGCKALSWNTDGIDNTALGQSALFSNTSGSNNLATGSLALSLNRVCCLCKQH